MARFPFLSVSRASTIDLLSIVIIAGFGWLFVLPAMLHGAFDAMDLPFHLKWSRQFAEQFWMGDLYPRWLYNMNAGLGSPTFFFYAPVPYYLTSLLHPFFPNDPQNWGQLSTSVAIAMVASGLTTYLWLHNLTSRKAALVGSILYMALPYHLGTNLYWRFAFAEYWALVWIPLILYFSYKLVHSAKFAIVGLAISYALLVMTHLPTLVMFSAIPIFYVFAIASVQKRSRTLIRLALALVLGIGLAAIYWLPAMTTQAAISMSAILEAGYFYGNNFLFSEKAAAYHNQNLWTYLEIVSALMIALAGCAFAFVQMQRSTPTLQRESTFWFVIAIGTFLMMVPLSQPIWHILPPLQRIQFPWRFNTLLLVAVTALVTFAIQGTTSAIRGRQKAILAIGVVLTLSLLLSNGMILKQRLKPRPNFDVAAALATSQEEALEYRPRWVSVDSFRLEGLQKIRQRLPQGWAIDQAGQVEIREWKPRKITVQTNVPTETQLTLRQFYYPGWVATSEGNAEPFVIQPSQPEGLLQVKIPSGTHEIQLTLEAGIIERSGQVTSAIAVVLLSLLGGWLVVYDRTRRTSIQNPQPQEFSQL